MELVERKEGRLCLLSKCLWEAEMENLDIGKSGSGGSKLLFSLVQHSLSLGEKVEISGELLSRNRYIRQEKPHYAVTRTTKSYWFKITKFCFLFNLHVHLLCSEYSLREYPHLLVAPLPSQRCQRKENSESTHIDC